MPAYNADVPVPSIETASQANRVSGDSLSLDSPHRLRTPSVSVTPPRPSPSLQDGVTRRSNGSGQDTIATGMSNIRLSDSNGISNMHDLSRAVEAAEKETETPAASLSPEPTDSRTATPRQRRRSRRSSARADQSRHDVLEEDLPQDAFHTPQFQQAFRDAKQLMSNVEGVLGSSSLHNDQESTMRRLYEQAGELARFEYPSTRTVGFVGDSGVGKSSLLNSLLDTKGLARTSNSGEACTCVVTEYHYHNRDTLSIEVELFTLEELRDQLSAMLQTYRHFHLNGDEMEDAERRDMEASANVAKDTFRAMFRDQMNDEAFLIDSPEDVVLRRLARWAESLFYCVDGVVLGASKERSVGTVAFYPKHQACLYSFFSLKDEAYSEPGLRDLNSARRIITERYLLNCNEIFAICNIGRAVTDEGVNQVFELARRAHMSNVGIVCTRSDDIIAQEAVRDWRGPKAKDIGKLLEAIDTDDRDEKEVREEIADYEGDEDLSDDEMIHRGQLYRRQENIRTRNRNHHFELKTYLVTTRNTFVTRELRGRYNERVATDEIKVFCVSNKDYWDHREEPKQTSGPFLQLSGILQVRKYCISIVANSQRRFATQYMRDQIPALVAQVDLWVQSGARSASEERREALCRTLDEVERQLRRKLTSVESATNRIAHHIKRDFAEYVYGRRRIAAWSRSARDASEEWAGWHHASYSAFCRQYGDHTTPAVGSRNWNEEAIAGMVQELENPWQDLCVSLKQGQTDLVDHIISATNTATERFENELDNDYETTAPLMQTLATRQQILLDSVERGYDQFETDLNVLRVDALSGIRSSIFGTEMESPYRRCNQEGGRGSDGRRKAIIGAAIAGEDIFTKLMRRLKDEFSTKADGSQHKVQEDITAYLNVVQETFDLVRSENVARESEQDPDFRLRVEEVVRIGRDTIRRVQGITGV
ncbi:hypothetical protein FZEAL_9822 [Fusarium zealandicum]|uniref:DUF7605 domain-containing protein n=1 Tax=Fusarium zealandicum TaxID=1053134 RepID=A0A8H4XDW0_9HYPO|nr:hypothetical protein FZEAL_9822 [Fusarium zealandicum]